MTFLSKEGLNYFWQQICARFVVSENGKGLSTNDYTNEDKTKLTSLEAIEESKIVEICQ